MNHSSEAERLVESGNELSDASEVAEAERTYVAAAKLAPTWSVPLYNLGLLCKYQGRWDECLEFNQRAAELESSNQATWWNLGIAATALRNWTEARRAWQACGITLPATIRLANGVQRPVFNALSCLERSAFKTFVVELGTSDPVVIERLEEVAELLAPDGDRDRER